MGLTFVENFDTVETNKSNTESNAIAIVGMSANLPTGATLEEYWEALKLGEDYIQELSTQRKEDIFKYYEAIGQTCDKPFIKAGFLEEIDKFDNRFFNISPKEAELMSPINRMQLEVIWHALEDAGYLEAELNQQKIGVFAGMVNEPQSYDYYEYMKALDPSLFQEAMSVNLQAMTAARISYYLNLKGPSVLVDTACASSAYSIIEAANSLLLKQCDAAVATGGRLIYRPFDDENEKLGIESSDGKVRAFDELADGTGFGEGFLAIVLKRLEDAEADHDRIYGVLKGYATNQDGKTMGITAPSVESQIAVIEEALANAKVSADSISFYESHGTGTDIGDLIEISGIHQAFGKTTTRKNYCAVSSLKNNIGHLYGASGIASVIKCLLAMNKEQIPPTIHFRDPNHKIDFVNSPLYVNAKLRSWETDEVRRCCINSFSIIGTNCCLILEEYKNERPEQHENLSLWPVTITAKTKDSLRKLLESYEGFLANSMELCDISFSSLTRRNHFPYRYCFLVKDVQELRKCIKQVLEGNEEQSNSHIFYGEADEKANEDVTSLLKEYRETHKEELLVTLVKKYCEGAEFSWKELLPARYSYIQLPAYPFEQKRFWIPFEEDEAQEDQQEESEFEITGEGGVSQCEKKIGDIWCRELGFDSIDVEDDFFDLGGDSIYGIGIVQEINAYFHVKIAISDVLNCETIRNLAELVQEEANGGDKQTIEKAEKKEFYALSGSQLRFYLLAQLEENSTKYNINAAYVVNGKIDVNKLESAFNKLVEQNEILRTAFVQINDMPMQKIEQNVQLSIEVREKVTDIEQTLKDFVRAFDLSKPPLFRVLLGNLEDGKQILMFDMHHIVTDGTSFDNLIKKLQAFYEGQNSEADSIQYKDFSEYEKRYELTDAFKDQREYWLSQFKDSIPVSNFPTQYERTEKRNVDGRRYAVSIQQETVEQLNAYCNENKVTPFMVTLEALFILVHKYSGDDDVCIGTANSGRNVPDVQNMLGCFINTLPMRCSVDEESDLKELQESVKEISMGAFDHAAYGYEKLIDEIHVSRTQNRNPLFDIMFIYQNLGDKSVKLGDIQLEQYQIEQVVPRYDITLELLPVQNKMNMVIEYAAELYDVTFIQQMGHHFIQILNGITQGTCKKVSEIPMMDKHEQEDIISLGKGESLEIKDSIIDLWYKALDGNRNREAVVFHKKSLTYEQLNELSNRIANYLSSHFDIAHLDCAVLMERSELLIATLLGVLKAGGRYIPLDPTYPKERVEYIFNQCDEVIVLTTSKVGYDSSQFECIRIDDMLALMENSQDMNSCNMGELAYTIYTSGSTGKPKGVMIGQLALSNFVRSIQKLVDFDATRNVLGVTTISFDIFVLEMYVTLCSGSKLVLADEEQVQDGERLMDLILEEKVNVAQFTPSRLQMLLLAEKSQMAMGQLETLFVGGEALHDEILRRTKEICNANIINMYGPTETTVWSTYKDMTKEETVTIGRPIHNTNIYLLTKSNDLQVKNVVGEIAIGGLGLANGYVHNEELTNSKFISPEFAKERIYKTGDLGRWLENGELECLGRIDNQEKIRGYRVELGEIESVITEYPEVKKCAVITKVLDDVKRIIAFVELVQIENEKVAIEEYSNNIREHAKEKLPDYMIPATIQIIEKIPMTPNGKIDRNALRDFEIKVAKKTISKPKNKIEEKLLHLFSKILKIDSIGTDERFFDIGGNSLLLIVLLNSIKAEFHISLTAENLIGLQTIEQIGNYIIDALLNKQIEGADEIASTEEEYGTLTLQKAPEQETYELSDSQKRIYLAEQITGNQEQNVIYAIYQIDGSIQVKMLEEVVNKVINRHEILRTAFINENGIIRQKINKNVSFRIDVMEDCVSIERLKQLAITFDLEQPPFIKIMIGKLEDGKQVLMIGIHHIIIDGSSFHIFIQELAGVYNGLQLKPLQYQYKDYSDFTVRFKESDSFKQQEMYWINKFADGVPSLNLPTSFERKNTESRKGARYQFVIDSSLSEKIVHFAEQYETTSYNVALTALFVLLHSYSKDENIAIGTAYSGRNMLAWQDMIGVFINLLVVKCKIKQDMTLDEIRECVRKDNAEAIKNSDYGFDMLVDALKVKREANRNPIFDVLMIFQSFGDYEVNLNGARLNRVPINEVIPAYDLVLECIPGIHTFTCNIEYDCGLFTKAYIENFTKRYCQVLEALVDDASRRVGEISLMTEEQKSTILQKGKGEKKEIAYNVIDMWYNHLEQDKEKTALVCDGISYTYGQIEERSNQIAHYITRRFGEKRAVHPVIMERSVWLICTLVGILKAGCGYVPIDPTYPQDRIEYILENQKADIVFTTRTTHYNAEGAEAVYVEEIAESEDGQEKINHCSFDGVAYTIYTSGSTGKPKGVIIRQREMSNFVEAMKCIENFDQNTVMLGVTTVSFDIFVLESYVTLCTGGKLVLATEEEVQDVLRLAELIFENHVNMVQFTPSRLQMMLALEKSATAFGVLNTVFVGGEPLHDQLLEDLKNYTDARIINMYGPTETTVWSTYKDLTNDTSVTIGKPILNTDIYILDQDNRLQLECSAGEIAIGGLGVTKGYYENDELTREKFIQTDFADGIIYKTGDVGKWDLSGDLCCLGRMDHQVKIRGYRVELGEIEDVLLKHPIVSKCAVIAKEDEISHANYLVAFIGLLAGQEDLYEELAVRTYLKEILPEYMIPSSIEVLENFPLTDNGKINKKELLKMEVAHTEITDLVGPASEAEERLLKIWEHILNCGAISCNSRFFDVGGNSMLLIMLIKEIQEEFGISIPAATVYNLQTINSIAEYIIKHKGLATSEKEQDVDKLGIFKSEEKEYCELSSAQLRLYLLWQMAPESTRYNISSAFISEKSVDKERLEGAFNEVIKRHEILRTAFVLEDGEPVQKIHPELRIQIELRKNVIDPDALLAEFVHPFDLAEPLLLRVCIGELKEGKQLLLFDIHHIIADGISLENLIGEVETFYNGRTAEPLELQYRDYCAYQKKRALDEEIIMQREYWIEKFKDGIPKLNMTKISKLDSNEMESGRRLDFKIQKELYAKIQYFSAKYNYTPFMVTMSALYLLFYKYTRDKVFAIGTPVAGRNSSKLNPLIGTFVNPVVMKCSVEEEDTVFNLLNRVKEVSLDAFEHADYGYELLSKDMNNEQLFDVMFVYQTFGDKEIILGDSKLEKYPIKRVMPRYEFTMELLPSGNELEGYLEYGEESYEQETVELMIAHYIRILEQLVEDGSQTVKNLSIFEQKELEELIVLGEGPKEKVEGTVIDKWYQILQNPGILESEAVISADGTLSYQELNKISNQIACYLTEHYASVGVVPVIMARTPYMIAALLGILKAGKAYLPIAPDFPEERIQYILEDAECKMVFTDEKSNFLSPDVESIILDKEYMNWPDKGDWNQCSFEKESYVIYTSGSTGKPKGVIIRQQEMSNFVQAIHHIDPMDGDIRMLCVTTISFDIFVLECFVTLCYGKQMVLANEEIALDIEKFAQFMKDNRVNRAQFTPSRLQMLLTLDKCATVLQNIKVLFVGGEPLPDEVLKEAKRYTGGRILNMYGPTETTVWSTYKDVTDDEEVTIGRPIDNTTIYILDQQDGLCYKGGIGEIAIGGLGVTKGYVNKEELTNSKFIRTDFQNGLIYKTGDLGRWDKDGNLICLGRMDFQVKVRGYRVELGEIEQVLLNHPLVKMCAAVVKNVSGSNIIIAFVELVEDLTVDRVELIEQLREYLSEKLTDYMVPGIFEVVDTIPLMGNGKVNRNELKNYLITNQEQQEKTKPSNEIEEKLFTIWKELLMTEEIGCDQKFFQVGGNSLLLIKMMQQIETKLQVKLTAGELFKLQTIHNIANYISKEAVEIALTRLPEKFFLNRVRTGMRIKQYAISKKNVLQECDTEDQVLQLLVAVFTKLLHLAKADEVGLNISTLPMEFHVGMLSKDDGNDLTSIRQQIDKILSGKIHKDSELVPGVKKENQISFLIAYDYPCNPEVYQKKFDVIINFLVEDATIQVKTFMGSSRINGEAIAYLTDKLVDAFSE